MADTFAIKPTMLQPQMNEVFQLLDAKPQSIQKAIVTLEELNKEIDLFIAGI